MEHAGRPQVSNPPLLSSGKSGRWRPKANGAVGEPARVDRGHSERNVRLRDPPEMEWVRGRLSIKNHCLLLYRRSASHDCTAADVLACLLG